MLSSAILRAVCPGAPAPEIWADAINAAAERFEISTALRLAAFLAQLAHESSELRRLVELFDHRAQRICALWPQRFPTLLGAQPYAHAPEKLANHVYASRMGNGPEDSGDGWVFRGRGPFMLTGRGNYRRLGRALALPLEAEPDRVEDAAVGALVAAQIWQAAGLNELADGDDDEDFATIVARVAGREDGLPSRLRYWAKARAALGIL